jgi:hypothetical protein
MAKFKKGQVGNPKGCPKGAHHIGRPKDEIKAECYQLATEAAPLILARFVRMSLGEDADQVVNENGERLPIPAPTPTQVKAGEVVLNYVLQKAAERLEVTGADGDPLNGVPTDTVVGLIEAIRRRTAGAGGEKP